MLCDLSLKWNNHCSTFMGQISTLHRKQKFCDSTIACNGKHYHVHKIVLATCSDYFDDMLEDTFVNMHPILVLTDVSNDVIEALLQYMYLGEACVKQETFPDLLSAAKSFKIKGLATSDKLPEKNETLKNTFSSETDRGLNTNANYGTVTGNNDIGSKTKFTEQHAVPPELLRTYCQNVSGHETLVDVVHARKVFGKARRGKLFSRTGKRTFNESNNDGQLDSPSKKKFVIGDGPVPGISDQPSLVINRVTLPLKISHLNLEVPGLASIDFPDTNKSHSDGIPVPGKHHEHANVEVHSKLAESSAILEVYGMRKEYKEQENHWLHTDESQMMNQSLLSLETDGEMMPIITDCYSLQCTEQQQSSANMLEKLSNQLQLCKSWHPNSEAELVCGEDEAYRNNDTAFNESYPVASAGKKILLKKNSFNDACWSIVPENVSDTVSAQANVGSREGSPSGENGKSTDNGLGASSRVKEINYNQCPFCLFSFRDNAQLRGHIEVRHPTAKEFPCSICTFVYFDEVTLNHHTLNRHSSLPPLKEKSSSEKINETIDKVINKGELKISDECRPKLSSIFVKLHKNQDGQNKCTNGKLKFKHIKDSARIFKRHRCPHCDHTNKVKDNLKSHMRRHYEKKKYCCNLCSYSSCHEIALLRHSKNDHNTSKFTGHEQGVISRTSKYYKKITNRGESEQFSCLACSFITERELCMLDHIQVHTDCHKCPYCDFKSYTLGIIAYHKKRSMGSALYTCKHCGYKACYEKQLNKHLWFKWPMTNYIAKCELLESDTVPVVAESLSMSAVETPNVSMKETAPRPLKCSRCSFSASKKRCMLKHLQDHVIDSRNTCSRCDYKTNLVANLIRHQRQEFKQLYSCKNCDYKACFQWSLLRHQKYSNQPRYPCKENDVQKFTVVSKEEMTAVPEHFSEEVASATQADCTRSEQDVLQQHESLLDMPLCKQDDSSCRGALLMVGSTPAQKAGETDSLDVLGDASSELGHLSLKMTEYTNIIGIGRGSCSSAAGASINVVPRESVEKSSVGRDKLSDSEDRCIYGDVSSKYHDGGLVRSMIVKDECVTSSTSDGVLLHGSNVRNDMQSDDHCEEDILYGDVNSEICVDDVLFSQMKHDSSSSVGVSNRAVGSSSALKKDAVSISQGSDMEDEFLYGEINGEQNIDIS